jgi:hypothetical protein
MTGQIFRETPRQVHINGKYQTILSHHRTKLQYELFTTERSEPAVKSLTSGKTFLLTGSDLVDLAIAAGVDNDDTVPKRRKWPQHKPTPMKPLYESKPVPSQSLVYLAGNLIENVSVYAVPEKLANCVNYQYHLNRRVNQDVATYLKKSLNLEVQNIVVVDLIRDAKFLAEQLKCDFVTGNTSSREPEEIWKRFHTKASVVVVTTAMLPTDHVPHVADLHWVSLKLMPANIASLVRRHMYQLKLYHRHDTIFDRTSIKRNLALFQQPKPAPQPVKGA